MRVRRPEDRVVPLPHPAIEFRLDRPTAQHEIGSARAPRQLSLNDPADPVNRMSSERSRLFQSTFALFHGRAYFFAFIRLNVAVLTLRSGLSDFGGPALRFTPATATFSVSPFSS